MNIVSSGSSRLAASLGAVLSLAGAAQAQPACLPATDGTARAAATAPEAARVFQQATPEARNAFVALQAAQIAGFGGRIVGGEPVLFSDHPWQIAMVRAVVPEPQRSQFCGGSIVGDVWVLTAAHCVDNGTVREDPARVDVVAGSAQYGLGGERLDVAAIHTHPGYDPRTMDQDFALLRLATPVTLGRAVKLADESTPVADGAQACVTGWGATAEGSPGSVDLLGAEIPVVSNTDCNRPESYGGDITANMLCAGERAGGVDSCQGDSGGPLWTTQGGIATLTGVVSWGEGCARRLKYGVYARVSAAASWIASTMAGR